jgi:hypothetical protein
MATAKNDQDIVVPGLPDAPAQAFQPETLSEPTNVLDQLRSVLQEKVIIPLFRCTVPTRPTIEVEFDVDIDANILQMWQKRSRDTSLPDNLDIRKFSSIVLLDRCRGIYVQGQKVVDTTSGENVTFNHPILCGMLGVTRPIDAVKAMYGPDAAIMQTTQRVMEEAGYGDEVNWGGDDDPTVNS